MHEVRKPKDQVLKKNSKCEWIEKCQEFFNKFQKILQPDFLLIHFNPKLPIAVADASQISNSSYIFHKFEDGSRKEIYHASRSLTGMEQKYNQIEKEVLALVFAVKKFHPMKYESPVTFQSVHNESLHIFGSKEGISVYTANRLQRYTFILKTYDLKIDYIKTENFGYADILSRLIKSNAVTDE